MKDPEGTNACTGKEGYERDGQLIGGCMTRVCRKLRQILSAERDGEMVVVTMPHMVTSNLMMNHILKQSSPCE
jgi:hypothetical protein